MCGDAPDILFCDWDIVAHGPIPRMDPLNPVETLLPASLTRQIVRPNANARTGLVALRVAADTWWSAPTSSGFKDS